MLFFRRLLPEKIPISVEYIYSLHKISLDFSRVKSAGNMDRISRSISCRYFKFPGEVILAAPGRSAFTVIDEVIKNSITNSARKQDEPPREEI